MKKIISIMLIASVLIGCAALAASVRAYDEQDPPLTNPFVWATNSTGLGMQDIFQLNEQIHIKGFSQHKPYNMTLTDPDNIVQYQWNFIGTTFFDSGLLSTNATNKLGVWTINLYEDVLGPPGTPVEHKIGVGTYNVIPEATLGVIGLLGACFAGFGLKSLRVKKKA